jgi:hypothetical protein
MRHRLPCLPACLESQKEEGGGGHEAGKSMKGPTDGRTSGCLPPDRGGSQADQKSYPRGDA